MKSSQLRDIIKSGQLVVPFYFLKNYKKLELTMEEFIFLMYFYHLGERFLLDPERYCSDLNLDISSVMNYISVLTDKGFIRVEVLKNDKGVMEEYVLLEPFFQKMELIVMDESNNSSADSNIYEVIEKEFGRTISPMEYEIIKAWLDNHMSEELITEAVREATFNGVSNLRYIDKILFEWGKKGIKTVQDVEKMRKKREKKDEKDVEIDMDLVDWNWFDEDE
jgi:DNA replication protein